MAFDLVLFGGTGDLSWRKLMPALFQAFRHGSLPAAGRILAIGRDDLSHAQYRALIRTRFEAVEGAKRPSDEEFEAFSALLRGRDFGSRVCWSYPGSVKKNIPYVPVQLESHVGYHAHV